MSDTSPNKDPISFATPATIFSQGALPPGRNKADMKTTFPLTPEDIMFINSTDAAQQAAKDALNAVIAAAQDNFAATSRRLGVDRANFFKIIAARHNIDQASARRLRLNMTDELFIVDSEPTTAPPSAATDINANGIPAEVLEFMKDAAAK